MLDKGQIKDWDGGPEQKPVAPEPTRGPVATALFEGREALPTGERVTLTPEQVQARKKRGQWIALALFAFIIIIFVLTMTKMGGQIMVRDL
jgi:hypothetical protein